MRSPALAAALLLSILGSPTLAQNPAEHEGHHPEQKEAPAAKSATPPEATRGTGPSQGMMGGGMMNMMGGNMQMSDMMRTMSMMRQCGDNMGGMETIDRVEGRIAFLRTELKITDAQQSAWNAFADALRTNAKTLGAMRSSMMMPQQGAGSPKLVEKLTLQEKWMAARLEGTRAMKSALSNLVTTFSEEQKKATDELLAPHMGMMPMVQGGRMGMPMQGR